MYRFSFVHEDLRIVFAVNKLLDLINSVTSKSYMASNRFSMHTDSLSFVVMTDGTNEITITPTAGKYFVSLSGDASVEVGNPVKIAILKNSQNIIESERNIELLADGVHSSLSSSFHTQLLIDLNGTDSISGGWMINNHETGAVVTSSHTTLVLVKVS